MHSGNSKLLVVDMLLTQSRTVFTAADKAVGLHVITNRHGAWLNPGGIALTEAGLKEYLFIVNSDISVYVDDYRDSRTQYDTCMDPYGSCLESPYSPHRGVYLQTYFSHICHYVD